MAKSYVFVTEPARLSYAKVYEPGTTPNNTLKYSCCVMMDTKNKKACSQIRKAEQEAIKMGLENNLFTKAHVKKLKLPVRDGHEEYEDGEKGKEFENTIFFNANSDEQPGIVGTNGKPFMDGKEHVYSGCYARVHVSFYPFAAKNDKGVVVNRGVAVGLQNIMFVEDGERLDGRVDAETAFADFAEADEFEEGEDLE